MLFIPHINWFVVVVAIKLKSSRGCNLTGKIINISGL